MTEKDRQRKRRKQAPRYRLRSLSPSLPKRSGGGRKPKRFSYIPQEPKAKPEPKFVPKPEKLLKQGAEPWTEPELKKAPKVIKYEVDTEALLKRLEQHIDENLLQKTLEKMEADFEKLQAEVLETKGSAASEQLPPTEKEPEPAKYNPHEITGYMFRDPMQGGASRPIEVVLRDTERAEHPDPSDLRDMKELETELALNAESVRSATEALADQETTEATVDHDTIAESESEQAVVSPEPEVTTPADELPEEVPEESLAEETEEVEER